MHTDESEEVGKAKLIPELLKEQSSMMTEREKMKG